MIPPETTTNPPEWQTAASAHLWMPYCQMKTAPRPYPVVATEGFEIIFADGHRVIDGLASWWTACHGYNHPDLMDAVHQQLQRMPHVMMGGVQHPQACRLARRLATLLPGDLNRVFFSDSGSVSIEVAMKMAVQYHLNRGDSGRQRFVSFRNAYHGDTTGAMALCDPETSMHAHFKGFLLEQYPRPLPHHQTEYEQLEGFLQTRTDRLAGIVIEPLIQGAGGMKFHGPELLAWLRQACDRHGLLLIADEIATGFGRTGTMFAIDQAEIVPDVICLGKALTGGIMGLAATVARDEVYEAFHSDRAEAALMHGPTFMGNPLACAAANASLDLFENEPRVQQAAAMEATLRTALAPAARFGCVSEVRCRGAVGVVQVNHLDRIPELIAAGVDRGIWIRPFKDMVYVTPALNMPAATVEHLAAQVVDAIEAWSQL